MKEYKIEYLIMIKHTGAFCDNIDSFNKLLETNSLISVKKDKLFFKKWVIGIFQGNIKDIIRSKTFDPDINWLLIKSFDKFYADPFLLRSKEGESKILFEEYVFDDDYAKISLMTLDKSLRQSKP